MLQATLKSLSETNRMKIVDVLIKGPRTVGELVERLELSQPLVSKHLRILNKAKLVEVRPVAQQRIYSLSVKPFQELDIWLQPFRTLWEDRFDRLDKLLTNEKKNKVGNKK